MKSLRYLFLFACLFLLSFTGNGQSLSDDLKAISGYLDSAKSVSLQVDIHVYSSRGGSEIYDASASVDRKGAASVTVLGDVEIYEDATWRVDVNHTEKFVAVIKKEAIQKAGKTAGVQFDVRELMKLLGDGSAKAPAIKLVSDAAGVRTYELTGIESLKEVRIVLDMNKKNIRSVTYEYASESDSKGQYIELSYTRFTVNETGKTLRASDYFTVSSKQYQLTARFKGYQLTALL